MCSRSFFHNQLFVYLGDDGTSKEAVSTGKLNQENEHIYNLWCSGRVCCEGMLIQLKVCEMLCRLVGCYIVLNVLSYIVFSYSFLRGRTF